MLVGRVALLELVEKAVTMLARIRLQNTRGDRPPSKRTNRERLTVPCSSSPNNTTKTYLERLFRIPQPNIEVVKKIRPNTPYGASFMARSMIFTTASPTASSTRTSGRARSSGMSVSAAPNTSEKKITPSRSMPAAA